MPSLPFFNVRFTPSWLMTFLTIVVIALFLRLGFWQVQRAHEKEMMLAAEQTRAAQKPVKWTTDQQSPLQYQQLIVEGHYLPNNFLLDNQHQQHQFGYDVITALEMDNESVVMIDRGWIPGDNTRRIFPNIEIPAERIQITGSVYYPSQKQWVLGPKMEKANKVIILELLDSNLLQQILQKKVYPFIIRLDKQEAYGFVREWAVVSMPPQRHLAYALQWFVMALVILIIFVALNIKKNNEKTGS